MGSRIAAYGELAKPRVVFLSALTAASGFLLASRGAVDPVRLALTLLGTILLAAASGALNQCIERDADTRMSRTDRRPLPSGRLNIREALAFGAASLALGLVVLPAFVNVLAAVLGAITVSFYLLLYTPLKRVTWLATWIGGVAGALPSVMGWAAAGNGLSGGVGILFLIIYLWQIPHFLAIAWMRREEYRDAGFPLLTVIDPGGRRMSRQLLLHMCLLLAASLLPFFAGMSGLWYVIAALALGAALLACCLSLALGKSSSRAKLLLKASVIYLPLLLAAMALDGIGLRRGIP